MAAARSVREGGAGGGSGGGRGGGGGGRGVSETAGDNDRRMQVDDDVEGGDGASGGPRPVDGPREDALRKANDARDGLTVLYLRRAELEEESKRNECRMNECDRTRARMDKDELEILKREHDDLIDDLVERMRVENDKDADEILRECEARRTARRGEKGAKEGGVGGTKRRRGGGTTQTGRIARQRRRGSRSGAWKEVGSRRASRRRKS